MSYAPERSRNGALTDGMTDGTYKKLVRDRGGFVETTTEESRFTLNHDTIAYQQTSPRFQPDGTTRYSTGDVEYPSQSRHQG